MHNSKYLQSFNYLGGKFSYLPWLLPQLPKCYHFIDVFGGSAVVLLNREPSAIETYNDINGKVVNFFEVLRTQPIELITALQLTPHSRKEYDNAWYLQNDSALEQARKFFIRTQQSMWAAGGQNQHKGWCSSINDSRTAISEKTHKWLRAIENLPAIVERLKTVQIECKDFRYIMKKYDNENHLLYLDSPYDTAYRSNTPYEFDFVNQDFFDLQFYIKRSKSLVALSGYDTPLMNELFSFMHKHDGPKRKNNRSDKDYNEILWTNYKL